MSRPQSHPSLSSIEALLLAQATWEYGAAPTNWLVIAKLLSKHPLLSRPKSFFTPQSCHSMYENILNEAGLEISEANNVPHADANLNLARKHYRLRFEELRELILAEESKFKTVLKEIEEIRAGLWDTKIHDGATDEFMEQDSTTVGVSDEILSSPSQTKDNSLLANAIQPGLAEMHLSPNKTDENDHASREMSSGVKSNSLASDDENADQDELDISQKETPQQVGDESDEHSDQRQEEEEEEEIMVEESKEEEEASQAQDEIENEDEAMTSAQLGAETDSEQEPVVFARRSSRRRKPSAMSVPQLSTRTRLRPRARVTSELQTADSDIEILPGAGEEGTSSPVDFGNVKRRDGKRKASFADSVDSPQDKKRLRGDSEPAEDEEPGLSSHNTRARATRNSSRTEEQVALKRFQNVIGMLHSQISQHRNGTIFHNPIKPSEAPDYHEIVKRPSDLRTIKARVKDGVISNSLEFQRDIYLMFANAMMYNRPSSDVYVMAEDMMLESEAQINAFRQTEGLVRRGQRP